MSTMTSTRRRPVASRRIGYAFAALANAGLLWLINVWPGWDNLTFLTDETPRALVLVNLSLVVSAAVNLVYLGYDAPWAVAFGGVVTTGLGLMAMVRIWHVFPFDFGGTFDWALVARVVLVVGMVGGAIGGVVQLGQLVGSVGHTTHRPRFHD